MAAIKIIYAILDSSEVILKRAVDMIYEKYLANSFKWRSVCYSTDEIL